MSEWWTYSLRDLLLFSQRTYTRLFELHNQEWWPLPLFALALGAVLFVLAWNLVGDAFRDIMDPRLQGSR